MDLVSNDGIRASDRDREQAVAILCEAYAAGRLDLDEIRDRGAATYRARTWGDLRRLTIDVPPRQAFRPRPPVMGAPPGTGPRCRPKWSRSPILLVLLASLAMAAATFMPVMGAPLVAIALIVLSVSALFAAGITATLLITAAGTAKHHAGDGDLYRDTI